MKSSNKKDNNLKSNFYKNKPKIVKILVNTCYSIPILFFLHLIISQSCPVQFANDRINYIISLSLCIIFPLIVITLFAFDDFTHSKKGLGIAIMFFIYPFVIFILLFFINIPRVDYKIYVNKYNENIKIERMDYDIGAYDSGNGGRIVKVNYFFPLLRYISEIDTNKINKNEWLRIK